MLRRILLLIVTVMILRVEAADACSCVPNGPPCEDYWKAAAVFRGRVEAIDSEPASGGRDSFHPKLVRFTVLERFFGIEDSEVTVWTPGGGGMCGYRFTHNREYIVYAQKGRNGRLMTSVCSRTAPVERGAADLEFARNIASGGRPLGLIEATVHLITNRESLWTPTEARPRPVPGLTIMLRRGDESFSATTDRAGRFAVSGLQPGTYRAELTPPDGTRLASLLPQAIELLDARGCATFGVELEPDGRMKGRVVDTAGRAVRGLTVALRQAQAANRGPALATNFKALTDGDGRFEIAGVPPGRFLLAAEASGTGRTLHPGVVDEARAERFELRTGSRLTVKDFTLHDVVTVTGVSVDSGRTPIEGARVYLREPTDGGAIVTLPVVTDWSGRFVISVPAGQEYAIFAERDRPGLTGRTDASEPVRIGPRSPDQPLVLTLRPRY